MRTETQGLLLGGVGVIAFALTLPATRYLVETLNPVFIGLGRSFFAAFIAAALLLISKQPWPSLRQLALLAIVAAGVVLGFPILSAIAMQSLTAAHGGVVLAEGNASVAELGIMPVG